MRRKTAETLGLIVLICLIGWGFYILIVTLHKGSPPSPISSPRALSASELPGIQAAIEADRVMILLEKQGYHPLFEQTPTGPDAKGVMLTLGHCAKPSNINASNPCGSGTIKDEYPVVSVHYKAGNAKPFGGFVLVYGPPTVPVVNAGANERFGVTCSPKDETQTLTPEYINDFQPIGHTARAQYYDASQFEFLPITVYDLELSCRIYALTG